MAEQPRYRFGPLERRGLMAGWRGGQIASVGAGLLVAVAVLHARPTPATAALAAAATAAGVALATWPLGGRTAEQWLPTVSRYGVVVAGGRHRHRASAPSLGHTTTAGGAVAVEKRVRTRHGGPFAGLALLGVEVPDGPAVGVVYDTRARTLTASLHVRGQSFALLGSEDQQRRVAAWSSVLAALARERSPLRRLQWVASVIPDDGRAIRAHLDGCAALGAEHPAMVSYRRLLEAAEAGASRHEVLLCVQTAARPKRNRVGTKPLAAACDGLVRELVAVRRLLADADLSVERTLGPGTLAVTLRRLVEPVPEGSDPGAPGPTWPWPMAVDTRWDCVRTDATWHAVFWIAEWPRVDVGADFLGALLLGSDRRSVSVVLEPVTAERAIRQVEQARTADLADAELRRRGGFLPTARRAREAELVARREAELADGHASYRFTGYVSVSAPSAELLDEACERTEQAAGQCRIELRRLYGDQDRALSCTLPLGRGLR